MRLDAEELLDSRLVDELLPAGVVDADSRGDELEHVFVRGDDDDLEAFRRRLCRKGSDDVVGLVAGQLEHGDPIGIQNPADVGDLRGQVRGHRDAVGFVIAVGLVAHGLLRPVPGDREQIRGVLPQHLSQHRHEPVDGVGGLAERRREALDRVVGAVDVGHRVHEVELPGGFRHGSRDSMLLGGKGISEGRAALETETRDPFSESRDQ